MHPAARGHAQKTRDRRDRLIVMLLLLLGIRFSERSINIPQNLRLNMHPMHA